MAAPEAVAAVAVAVAADAAGDMLWYRIPVALRTLLLIAAWFTFGAVLSNLNSLDDGNRTAEIIWGACLVGTCISVIADLSRSPSFEKALRTGNLTDGIDVTEWRHRLTRSSVAAWLTPLYAFPYLVFGALSADSSRSHYRVLLIGLFALSAIWIVAAARKRITRIKHLQSAVRQRNVPVSPKEPAMPRMEKWWRSNAESSWAGRLVSTVVATSVIAFVPVALADLDSIVYSANRGSHLGWAALCAILIGTLLTVVAFGDPRMRATRSTIEAVLQYDRAFRTTELPDHFDIEQWRNWIKSPHRSDAVTLIWACFYLAIGGWCLLAHPPGYHWIVAVLLAALAVWQIRRWQHLCALTTRLSTVVERHAMRQLFG